MKKSSTFQQIILILLAVVLLLSLICSIFLSNDVKEYVVLRYSTGSSMIETADSVSFSILDEVGFQKELTISKDEILSEKIDIANPRIIKERKGYRLYLPNLKKEIVYYIHKHADSTYLKVYSTVGSLVVGVRIRPNFQQLYPANLIKHVIYGSVIPSLTEIWEGEEKTEVYITTTVTEDVFTHEELQRK